MDTQSASRGLSIVAVGDLQLGDSSTATGFGFRSLYSHPADLEDWVRSVSRVLGTADIVFGNLETVLSPTGLRPGEWRSFQMRGDRSYVAALADAGFTVLNVANNHSMQHGEAAFEETVDLLAGAGIQAVGLRGKDGWTAQPLTLDVGDSRVGFLGYSFRPRQYSSVVPLYAEGDRDSVCSDVRRLAGQVDHVIVSLHWGEEFVEAPSVEEVHTARAIVQSGASLLIGHHPHVLRRVQQLEGGLVAYSLGNFSGDMIWHEPLRTGGVLRAWLGEDVPTGWVDKVRVGEDYLPLSLEERVEPAAGLEALSMPDYTEAISSTQVAQRRSAYRYALRNVHRFPPRMLFTLLMTTAANKIRSLRPSGRAGGH